MSTFANKWDEALWRAISDDKPGDIESIIARGANIDFELPGGQTPLGLAISLNKTEAALKLLELGADVKNIYIDGDALIHAAARKMDSVCLKLIEKNVDVDVVDSLKRTAFTEACRNMLHDVCLKLAQKIDVTQLSKYGNTPLHLACATGFTDVFDILVQRGADIVSQNELGQTPFLEAITYDQQEICRKLIEMKTNINHRDRHGNTPLMVTMKSLNHHPTWFLLRMGASHEGADPAAIKERLKEMRGGVLSELSKDEPEAESKYLQDGKPTDAVLDACATDLLQDYVMKPLLKAQDKACTDLCFKILASLPPHWKNHYAPLRMSLLKEYKSAPQPDLSQRHSL